VNAAAELADCRGRAAESVAVVRAELSAKALAQFAKDQAADAAKQVVLTPSGSAQTWVRVLVGVVVGLAVVDLTLRIYRRRK
jgi:hypothetical protein